MISPALSVRCGKEEKLVLPHDRTFRLRLQSQAEPHRDPVTPAAVAPTTPTAHASHAPPPRVTVHTVSPCPRAGPPPPRRRRG
eukprot:381441-Hanusia_phi.AAC.1